MSETPSEDPLTIETLRDFLKLTKRDEDDTDLQETLDASIERVQDMVDVALGEDHVTYRPRAVASGALMIPPGAVELVTIADGSGTTRTVDDLDDVDLDAGLIWPGGRYGHAGRWTITVRRPGAGAAVILAVKIIAKHLWGVHRGGGGREGPRGGVIAQDEAALAGFAIPRRARELLEPYMTGGGFA